MMWIEENDPVAILPKRKILLIDDDPLIQRIITQSLTASGFQVEATASGRMAIAMVQKDPPDLILLDVMMPEMNGFEVCLRLRQEPQGVSVPVIMLTAMDETESVVKGLRSGADDYVTKPFEIDELVMRVEAHLRRTERDVSANPLTTLPGNPVIEQVIQQRIDQGKPLAVLYIDLTNFKAYNDEYGWLKGDHVIKMLAQRIIHAVRLYGNPDDFVGHVGGDDFIAVSTPDCAESIPQFIIDEFDSAIPSYYSEDARERGYIHAVDRRGKAFRAPMSTVSIGIVTNKEQSLRSVAQVSARAAEVKKYVKALAGSHFAFDRRHK
jgi:diguanylate cyclase (GGDEF)-like protein